METKPNPTKALLELASDASYYCKHLRIVLLSVDDECAGEMQRYLYDAHPDWIVGSVISTCKIYKRSKLGGLWFVLRKSGLVFLANMINVKMIGPFVNTKRGPLPSELARRHGVERFKSANINDEQSVAKLRDWNPDLIISTNFSHYVGKTVRENVARFGCWNLHKALLPNFRGMAPSFHALLEGVTKVGATLHIMSKGLDEGDILAQVEVPVTPGDSVHHLNKETSSAGGRMLATFLEKYDPKTTRAVAPPPGNWRNYSYPTRAEVRSFLKKGLRFYSRSH